MTDSIIYFIAGGSVSALLIVWFFTVRQRLVGLEHDVQSAAEQVRLHTQGLESVYGTPREASARRVLSASQDISARIRTAYNAALKSPLCKIPGYLMGFRPLS